MKPSEKLAAMNLTLPALAAPIGSYVPANRCGNIVYSSGQLCFRDGKLIHVGKVPLDVPLEQAADAARQAMLNALSACANVAGGVDRIARVVRVVVFVNSAADFYEHPKVANGASNLLTEIFGDAGKHARSALGAAALPMNSVVEVELTVEVAG